MRQRAGVLACGVLLCCAALALPARAAEGAADATGHWEGAIETPPRPIKILVDLARGKDAWTGTIDIPAQGARGLPLTKVEVGVSVRFGIAGVPGDPTFDGTLKDDKMSGTYRQHGASIPFSLTRTARAPVARAGRPQEPKGPLPYAVEEVTFKSGANTLAGTLTLPPGKGPHPAAVLVTGSGPQNRDEELMGHKPFLVLADHLTRAGVAVLRADDRGVGKSTGEFGAATTADFTDDALAAVAFLKGRSEIARGRIGLIGHSEGGVVAPLAASRSKDVAFVVMLAGTGVPGIEISMKQVESMLQRAGLPPEKVRKQLELNRSLLDLLKDGTKSPADLEAGLEAIVERHLATMTEPERKATGGPAGMVAAIKASAPSPVWSRYFLNYDPRPALAKLTVPVLALNGELDVQVSADQNVPEVEKALKASPSRDVTVKRLPGLDHLFQKAKTGAAAEYAEIEETMDPEVLKLVSEWVVKRFGAP